VSGYFEMFDERDATFRFETCELPGLLVHNQAVEPAVFRAGSASAATARRSARAGSRTGTSGSPWLKPATARKSSPKRCGNTASNGTRCPRVCISPRPGPD
jgi:hypothetical protein